MLHIAYLKCLILKPADSNAYRNYFIIHEIKKTPIMHPHDHKHGQKQDKINKARYT